MDRDINIDKTAAIFGGEGNMGKITVEMFQQLGFETISVDPTNPESLTPAEAIERSKVVFFSVLPIEVINEIVTQNSGLFDNHMVLDNASVKEPFADAFKELDARGISVCSTHPMTKHDQPLHGQKVLILEVGNNAARARELAEALYKNAGMVTIPLSFESHDASMAVVQLVPHLVMRAVGRVFEKKGVDIQSILKFAPANFQLFNLSMWRTLVQDPEISSTVIASLQKQPTGSNLGRDIQEAIEEIVEQEDQVSLTRLFEGTAATLGKNNLGEKMNETTITVIERLANIDAKSVIVEVKKDKPGLLRTLLFPFEELGINLTAIDSHKSNAGVRFDIGIDESTCTPDVLAKLSIALGVMGHSVVSN